MTSLDPVKLIADPASILRSKTFWTNVAVIGATAVGKFSPTIGDFLKENALILGTLVGGLNIGLRRVTKEPVVFRVTKRF